mgnify:FL=1|tara:strand:+ start:4574 stop:4807 length:234 start_codon:yes stop_codon:yes gene_type:complete
MSEEYGRYGKKFPHRNRLPVGEFSSSTELRMEWSEAINTMEALVSFYDDYCQGDTNVEHDRNEYESVQNAWARIKQG